MTDCIKDLHTTIFTGRICCGKNHIVLALIEKTKKQKLTSRNSNNYATNTITGVTVSATNSTARSSDSYINGFSTVLVLSIGVCVFFRIWKETFSDRK